MSDHFRAYFSGAEPENREAEAPGEGRVMAPARASDAMIDDYFGNTNSAPMQVEMPDAVPWTIETAEETARGDVSGVDEITPVADQTDNRGEQGLTYPPHMPPNANEVGYGPLGAPAPFVASQQLVDEQRIVLAIAHSIVSETRALLTQAKVADQAHFETFPFAAAVIGVTQVGYRHPNQLGYLFVASAAGLYLAESQSVGAGNMGIPVPIGTNFVAIPANCNLFVSSAGVALGVATSLYVITLSMGSTTL